MTDWLELFNGFFAATNTKHLHTIFKDVVQFCLFPGKLKHIQRGPSKHIDLSLCWLNVVSLPVTLPNIKITLDRRFAFAGLTTVILIVKSSP